MCGIVGAIGERDIVPVLLEGLRRLEYRGYDSSGIAVINSEKCIDRERMLGKVQALADAMVANPINGGLGIAHTRWATHGQPSKANAHPHICRKGVAIVHNGIIENHQHCAQCSWNRGMSLPPRPIPRWWCTRSTITNLKERTYCSRLVMHCSI